MEDMVKTATVDGIQVRIDPTVLDDWDVFEMLADLQEDPDHNAFKSVGLLRILLGDEYPHVKDALRERNGGKLSAETMSAFMVALFSELSPNA